MTQNKILVVGDVHAEWGRLNTLINNKLPDIVLQVGDFGWWPMLDKQPRYKHKPNSPIWDLKGVKLPEHTVLYWCDGNHEDHEHLLTASISEINYNGVVYMPRGSFTQLPDGRTVMFIGGAESIDKHWRTPRFSWFHEETITDKDLDRCLSYSGRVDIVISHTAPSEFDVNSDNGTSGKHGDPSRKALSVVLDHFKPDLWYFGHWHVDQIGQHNNTRWQCLSHITSGQRCWDWLK